MHIYIFNHAFTLLCLFFISFHTWYHEQEWTIIFAVKTELVTPNTHTNSCITHANACFVSRTEIVNRTKKIAQQESHLLEDRPEKIRKNKTQINKTEANLTLIMSIKNMYMIWFCDFFSYSFPFNFAFCVLIPKIVAIFLILSSNNNNQKEISVFFVLCEITLKFRMKQIYHKHRIEVCK